MKGIKPYFLILSAVIIVTAESCSLRKGTDSPYATTFISYANGLADINLQLAADMNFRFVMTVLPEPGDTLAETFSFEGRWNYDHDRYFVNFNPSDEIDLHALVDPAYNPETNVAVIDERTLAFPMDAQEVVIWGIVCFRASQMKK
jgi:hypothetical protein